ncbi:MAG: site-2 protease family protein [Chromatiaceae bacterium]|nr:site-2 protease family protein [Gammaproteobacteria bacterium]MCB1786080.1 site-2 protease family protein [Gammaproteobacteria bacterium]MCP5307122.1 site-2 protease family protein [Chromatiaceae bacterium]MCP5312297.1 site-2 protease family protein [Chromatiaceae bacterium]
MEELNLVQRIAVWALPLIFAVTVHEAAHGWVADRLGDPTARKLGRITFNPIPHIDLVGTILVPVAMLALTGFLIGWAKPVPVVPARLREPRRDMAIVAAAGPGVNLLMALGWSLVLLFAHRLIHTLPAVAMPLLLMAVAGVFVNLVLMALNLLPVPPLDGGRILTGLLPPGAARVFARIEPFGLAILIALLVTNVLGMILGPVVFGAIALLPGSDLVLGILPTLFP